MNNQNETEDLYWAEKFKNTKWDEIKVNRTADRTQQPLAQQDIDFLRREESIEFVQRLGDGNFGSVWLATVSGTPFACKVIPLANTANETVIDAAKRIKNECEIMKALDHPNIVNARHVLHLQDRVDPAMRGFPLLHALIFMELFDQTLKDMLQNGEAVSEAGSMCWFRQIADAVGYLHIDVRVVHQDIHWGNIMIKYWHQNTNSILVKLADFGTALRESDCGTEWKAFGKYGKSIQCNPNYYESALKRDIFDLANVLSQSIAGRRKRMFVTDVVSSKANIAPVSEKYNLSKDMIELLSDMYANKYTIRDVLAWISRRPFMSHKYSSTRINA